MNIDRIVTTVDLNGGEGAPVTKTQAYDAAGNLILLTPVNMAMLESQVASLLDPAKEQIFTMAISLIGGIRDELKGKSNGLSPEIWAAIETLAPPKA